METWGVRSTLKGLLPEMLDLNLKCWDTRCWICPGDIGSWGGEGVTGNVFDPSKNRSKWPTSDQYSSCGFLVAINLTFLLLFWSSSLTIPEHTFLWSFYFNHWVMNVRQAIEMRRLEKTLQGVFRMYKHFAERKAECMIKLARIIVTNLPGADEHNSPFLANDVMEICK